MTHETNMADVSHLPGRTIDMKCEVILCILCVVCVGLIIGYNNIYK